MGNRVKGEAVYDRLASDEARTALRWIMEGRLDADLRTLIMNAQRREKSSLRASFKIGSRVRVIAPGKHHGTEGEVVKINRASVVVMTNADERTYLHAIDTLGLDNVGPKDEYASVAASAGALEAVTA